MARDPGSVWAPLPEAGAPDGYEKTQFIVHSTGDNGTAAATRRFFAGATLNESTFIVGQGPWDPTLQIMDSTDVADANGSANRRGISVEVAGDGVGGYNAWQRSELVRLGRWARAAHPGILPRIIPSEPAPGFGWHVMFGAPGPWAGVAKVCPGKQRIKELQTDIFPAIFAGTPLSEEDDMANYAEQLDRIEALAKGISGRLEGDISDGADRLQEVYAAIGELRRLFVGDRPPGDYGDRFADIWAVLMQLVAREVQDSGTPIDVDSLVAKMVDGMGEKVAGEFLASLSAKLGAAASAT